MILPGCQDTGTAIVMGKRGQYVWTDGKDEEHFSRGVSKAYTETNLRCACASQWGARLTRVRVCPEVRCTRGASQVRTKRPTGWSLRARMSFDGVPCDGR